MDLTELLTLATEYFLEEPFLRLQQAGVISLGSILVFLILYTLRDILLRSTSLLWMLFSILLVAVLPIVGFFIYLLVRPSRTIKEREMEMLMDELLFHYEELHQPQLSPLFESHPVPSIEKPAERKKKKSSKKS